jgi:hypothetical protein
MKKTLLTLGFVCVLLALNAQKNVVLHIIQKAGDETFGLGNTYTTGEGTTYKPNRLQYYISLPAVTHDGGQQTQAPNRYFLVDASEEDILLDLGEMNLENIEGITFSIGIDEARNHLDPAGYPVDHPLAPKNPSMHWGWAAGYIFQAFEGDCGANLAYFFQIHSIGNELYKTISLPAGADTDSGDLIIEIMADYNRLLDGIDLSNGPVSHGNLGPAGLIMDNFETVVFTAASPSSAIDRNFAGAFTLAPNPATDSGQARLFLPEGHTWQLTLTDLTGRTLSRHFPAPGFSALELDAPGPGMYLVQIWQDGLPAATEKWIVAH